MKADSHTESNAVVSMEDPIWMTHPVFSTGFVFGDSEWMNSEGGLMVGLGI